MLCIDDILNYQYDDLNKISSDDLLRLLQEAKDKADEYFTLQQSNKILINALYGAQGNDGFILFNEKIAQAITGNGRFFIKLIAQRINEKLAKLAKQQNIPSNINEYVYYGDTDSVVGNTIINTDAGQYQIQDLYKLDGIEKKYKPCKFIKKLNQDLTTLSVNDKKELKYKKIKYVMKHKVTKRMYKIKLDNKEIIVTADHSLIVLRNGKLLAVKPKDVLKTDKFITLEN